MAIYKISLSNITKQDLPVFKDITDGLFPDIIIPHVTESRNDVLKDAIKQTMLKNNHQPSESAALKIVQLHEIKNCRRSVIIIGRSGAAKSTTWKTLKDALGLLKREDDNTFEAVIVSRIKRTLRYLIISQ